MTIRSFFAVPLSTSLARRLADHADTLCGFDGDKRIRSSDSASYHLTLCFLGEIALDQVAALEQKARKWFENQSLFSVRLVRSGYLQINPQLVVLAAQAEPEPALMQLQQWVAELVAEVGIDVEEADFRPHITLGRLSAQAETDAMADVVSFDAVEGIDTSHWPVPDMRVQVDSLVLFQSKQGEQGSIYTPLFEIPLTARPNRQHDSAVSATA